MHNQEFIKIKKINYKKKVEIKVILINIKNIII